MVVISGWSRIWSRFVGTGLLSASCMWPYGGAGCDCQTYRAPDSSPSTTVAEAAIAIFPIEFLVGCRKSGPSLLVMSFQELAGGSVVVDGVGGGLSSAVLGCGLSCAGVVFGSAGLA